MLHQLKEVCQLTNLKKSSLRNAIHRKDIPAKKIGGVYYITDETLNDLLSTPVKKDDVDYLDKDK